MSNFGNFGTSLGQAGGPTTMVNPFFDFNGPFTGQAVQGVKGMVSYYPASFHHKKKHEDEKRGERGEREEGRGMHGSSRGYVGGYIGPILGSSRAMGR